MSEAASANILAVAPQSALVFLLGHRRSPMVPTYAADTKRVEFGDLTIE
jgi:hypothetical protein